MEENKIDEKNKKDEYKKDEYMHYSRGMISYIDYGGLKEEKKKNEEESSK